MHAYIYYVDIYVYIITYILFKLIFLYTPYDIHCTRALSCSNFAPCLSCSWSYSWPLATLRPEIGRSLQKNPSKDGFLRNFYIYSNRAIFGVRLVVKFRRVPPPGGPAFFYEQPNVVNDDRAGAGAGKKSVRSSLSHSLCDVRIYICRAAFTCTVDFLLNQDVHIYFDRFHHVA